MLRAFLYGSAIAVAKGPAISCESKPTRVPACFLGSSKSGNVSTFIACDCRRPGLPLAMPVAYNQAAVTALPVALTVALA